MPDGPKHTSILPDPFVEAVKATMVMHDKRFGTEANAILCHFQEQLKTASCRHLLTSLPHVFEQDACLVLNGKGLNGKAGSFLYIRVIGVDQ